MHDCVTSIPQGYTYKINKFVRSWDAILCRQPFIIADEDVIPNRADGGSVSPDEVLLVSLSSRPAV